MASPEEKINILKKIQDGKITAEEGVRLLEALGKSDSRSQQGSAAAPKTARWMRIVITDLNTGKEKINIRLPANVIDAGYKMGARYTPGMNIQTSGRISEAFQSGLTGKIVDVSNTDSGERVVLALE